MTDSFNVASKYIVADWSYVYALQDRPVKPAAQTACWYAELPSGKPTEEQIKVWEEKVLPQVEEDIKAEIEKRNKAFKDKGGKPGLFTKLLKPSEAVGLLAEYDKSHLTFKVRGSKSSPHGKDISSSAPLA